ncbi:MAG TPA: pyridoxamine 5'-phosphate oxidase family protein [Ilumatobacteraceae bacterium]|nr:pyridoxamine 5'-phosphate oxidase family protein [Ilumatobacteraceae bacterium]
MSSPTTSEPAHHWLLDTTRIGIVLTTRDDGSPIGVPIWFDWDSDGVRMFAGRTSGKIERLERDSRASVLVTNTVGEPEGWVAFDGTVEISESGGVELAAELADRYWDLNDPISRERLDGWLQHPGEFRLLTLRPERVRSGQ